MDRISLHGMAFFGRHGVTGAERETGHRFEVDVDAFADLREVGDDIDKTINYAALYDQVAAIVQGESYHLIEALAEALAAAALSNQLIEKVTIRVKKIYPPVEGEVRAAEVEVTRSI